MVTQEQTASAVPGKLGLQGETLVVEGATGLASMRSC